MNHYIKEAYIDRIAERFKTTGGWPEGQVLTLKSTEQENRRNQLGSFANKFVSLRSSDFWQEVDTLIETVFSSK